jgi:DNA helicase-2/ATP-dependent DNA helicase PcrA
MLNQSEMEEERRLMYVGITRAEEKVYLLFTNMRTIFGSTQSSPPSRFLDDIPTHLIEENTQPAFNNNYEYEEKSISYDENPDVDIKENKSFKDGDRVSHSEFGEGLVISNQDSELTIAFKNTGIKKLSSQYAKLKKI